MRQTPIAQGIGHRPVAPADVFQNLYGRRQPSAQSHPIFRSCYKSVSSPLIKPFRPGLKQFRSVCR
ncbi:hypothetical protein MPLDJ20_70234 [Mesorhizobium plurifarium]|uniref:Uncharacterized protein n=1 Tax=Mesorhizobium plurifarium TaxID=69974 RepID=A0A090FNZ2_MESPL|nr:hypothetical protein MPLDJ20_70234 [Mesorhizobium plurifarium]